MFDVIKTNVANGHFAMSKQVDSTGHCLAAATAPQRIAPYLAICGSDAEALSAWRAAGKEYWWCKPKLLRELNHLWLF